jgi:hypothetical protein
MRRKFLKGGRSRQLEAGWNTLHDALNAWRRLGKPGRKRAHLEGEV